MPFCTAQKACIILCKFARMPHKVRQRRRFGSKLKSNTGSVSVDFTVKCERCRLAGKAFCLADLNGTDLG